MLVALIALQLAGLAGLYLVLRRRIDRTLGGLGEMPELDTRVAALIAEMNGTAERGVTLLEDRIRCLDELLREADRRAPRPSPEGRRQAPAHAAVGGERETQVMRLRKLGFSSAVIADRLATSQGEVELILNLAADRVPVPHPPAAGTAAPPATRA